ncbi:hypothetical protein JW824_11445 [bacterium]|nr:hypothetical protein [bacterium]
MENENYTIQFDRRDQTFAMPGHLKAHEGDRIKFFAPQNTEVRIYIPNGTKLFSNVPDNMKTPDYVMLQIPSGGEIELIVDKQDWEEGKEEKIYPYAVYCAKENHFAEGGTSPGIIIERRQ